MTPHQANDPPNITVPVYIHAITENEYHGYTDQGQDVVRRVANPLCITLVVVIGEDDEPTARRVLKREQRNGGDTIDEIADTVTTLQALCGVTEEVRFAAGRNLPEPWQTAIDQTMRRLQEAIQEHNRSYET